MEPAAPSAEPVVTPSTPLPAPLPPPPRYWKMVLVTWLCLYPVLNTVLFVVWPYLTDWPLLARTLVITICVVPIMTLLVGTAQRRLFTWLRK